MTNNDETLAHIELFSSLTKDQLADVSSLCVWQSYPPGTHLIDRMSESMDVFFVSRGQVRVLIYSEGGREISIIDISEGGVFGELSALDHQPRSANVVTVYSTTVAQMQAEVFRQVLLKYPTVALELLRHLTSLLRNSTSRIMDLSTLSAHCRVYEEIRKLAEQRFIKHGHYRISPIPIHSELASRVSTTRETVARVFSELTRNKIIRKERNVIVVNDIKALEALIKANS